MAEDKTDPNMLLADAMRARAAEMRAEATSQNHLVGEIRELARVAGRKHEALVKNAGALEDLANQIDQTWAKEALAKARDMELLRAPPFIRAPTNTRSQNIN